MGVAVEILLATSNRISNLRCLKQLRISITSYSHSYSYSQGKVILVCLAKVLKDATKFSDSFLSFAVFILVAC